MRKEETTKRQILNKQIWDNQHDIWDSLNIGTWFDPQSVAISKGALMIDQKDRLRENHMLRDNYVLPHVFLSTLNICNTLFCHLQVQGCDAEYVPLHKFMAIFNIF
jgi:hypothetical protein